MAIKYGFFDASYDETTGEYDRQYFSDDMSRVFHAITGNGVFRNNGDALEVTPSGLGMRISVGTGFAMARGRYMENTEAYNIQLTAPSSNTKIDLIVARMSTISNERSFELVVKEGTPSSTPVAPTPTRNDGVYELCLAKITIPSSATAITDSMIEDTRDDDELCGYVSGLGGGAEFTDCTINSSVDAYSSQWLLDAEGNVFVPESKKVYRVITDGKYKDCIYLFNTTTNLYEGVGSYEVELTAEETLELWGESSFSRLSNIPAPQGALQYSGQEISPVWLYYDPTKVRIGGTTSATNAGNYYASFEPINGYAWPDGSTDVKYVMWTIAKKVVPIPVPTQTQFNYDNTDKTVVFNNLDTDAVTITNATAKNVGLYTVTATLNDTINTVWADNTYVQRAWNYKIAGTMNVVTLSQSSVTFSNSSDTASISVSSSSGGAVTVDSSDSNIVTASVSGSTITLTPGNTLMKGTATVNVHVAGGSNYEPGEATISVNKNYGVVIVSWADGTDEEIVGMIQAADNGDIDLHDYWHVGDERTVRIGAISASGSNTYGSWSVGESQIAQDVTMVLMDTGHFDLVTPVLDINKQSRSKCSFVVGLKNALLGLGHIDSSTSQVKWVSSKRYNWLNTGFAGAIPQTLISIFKRFVVGSAGLTAATPVGWSNDLFSLFAEKEIVGTSGGRMGNTNEWNVLSQIKYYETVNNRIKKNGDAGSNITWWTRSIANNNSYYVDMGANGSTATTDKTNTFGIAPFGCI